MYGERYIPTPGYTYYSSPHKQYSDIDMIFTRGQSLGGACIEICPQITTDHNPIMLTLQVTLGDRASHCSFSFPHHHLANLEYWWYLKGSLGKFLQINKGSAPVAVIRDCIKACIRGVTPQFILNKNRSLCRKLPSV